MALIKKITLSNTTYDVGADANNIAYNSNSSVKDKIDGYEEIVPSSASSSNKLATTNDIPNLTNYIEKSQTTGLVKNDGTIDTTTYISDISGKTDKVTSATSGNFAGLDNNGNLTDSGSKASDFAAASHNQASNTINAMTGYEKASAASAISTSDTLNQAIGKLEKAIESADIPIATTSVAGKVKPDGTTITIDANGTISSNSSEMSKTRYTITASSWSNSVDANGYYTYTITLNPTLSLTWPPSTNIAGVNDSTFSTDAEKEAYDLLDECNLTTTSTLILYAKTKPETTFYIWIEGEVA